MTRRIVVLNLGGLCGPGDRVPAAQSVPRRHHRGAHAEPDDAGRHHRRRRRCFRRQSTPTPSPSIPKSCCSSPRTRTPRRRRTTRIRSSFRSIPERVGPVLHRLVTPTRTRARIYDQRRPVAARFADPFGPRRRALADADRGRRPAWRRLWRRSAPLVRADQEAPRRPTNGSTNGKSLPEVADALKGKTDSLVRVDAAGETIVSVGVPIQRTTTVRGALLLSTQGGDIDSVIASERWALLRFFLVSGGGDAGAVAVARQHDRRTGAQARRRGRAGAARHQVATANSRLHRPRRTRSAISRARCAT